SSLALLLFFFFFSSRRRHTRSLRDWSSDVCSSDLPARSATASPTWFPDRSEGMIDLPARPRSRTSRGPATPRIRNSGEADHAPRSEERRVGKEGRSRWPREQERKKWNEARDEHSRE